MKIEETIGFQIRELSILMARYIEERHSSSSFENIRGPQMWALSYLLANQEREIFQKDLEKEMSIRKPTASNLVDRMVKNGYVTTVASARDKRFKRLLVTEKAVSSVQKIHESVAVVEETLRKDISEEELQQFFATIKKIKKNAKA